MKCSMCSGEIRPGAEERKRVEYRQADGGEVKVFGENMPDGRLEQAAGRLVRAAHQKCYWVQAKRTRRGGDKVLGTHPGLADPYDDEW